MKLLLNTLANFLKYKFKNILFLVNIFLFCGFANAALVPNTVGDEITDTITGLIWQRCPVGMAWSASTCSGVSTLFTHEQALVFAAQTSGNWRLPNVKELFSIVNPNYANPEIDPLVFPSTPAQGFWTVTTFNNSIWGVYFNGGGTYQVSRSSYLHLRLVR